MKEDPEVDNGIIECWCGANGTFEELFDTEIYERGCGGWGYMQCECGGDGLCVCHNHGEVECDGCADCRDDDDDYDDWDPCGEE